MNLGQVIETEQRNLHKSQNSIILSETINIYDQVTTWWKLAKTTSMTSLSHMYSFFTYFEQVIAHWVRYKVGLKDFRKVKKALFF